MDVSQNKGTINIEDIPAMKRPVLVQYCREYGLKHSGCNVSLLKARLKGHIQDSTMMR